MPENALPSTLVELKNILCCPKSKSPLSLITLAELLERLPEDEHARVPEATIGAFVSESSSLAYPIVGRIVDFLEQDALRISKDGTERIADPDAQDGSVLESVKRWYDEFGWQRNANGLYNDTALFSQVSLTAHAFYELSSHLSLLNRLSGGDLVLDAASGPIAHPESLAYSWFYRHHVCVDISLTALHEAQEKLAGKAFCCMADICELPFRDGVFDGVVSAYTIQHIEGSRQATAVAELHRVLKRGAHLCVISSTRHTRLHHLLVRALRALRKAATLLHVKVLDSPQFQETAAVPAPPHQLYSHDPDVAWWREVAGGLTDSYAIEGFRLFNKAEFESIFGESMRAAKAVRALETLFPKLAARMCDYILADLCKTNARPGAVNELGEAPQAVASPYQASV